MNAKYHGRKVIKDDFGNIRDVLEPVVEVNFTENEKDNAEKMLDRMQEWYSVYVDVCEDVYTATIPVCDREDGDACLKEWKELKARFKKGA